MHFLDKTCGLAETDHGSLVLACSSFPRFSLKSPCMDGRSLTAVNVVFLVVAAVTLPERGHCNRHPEFDIGSHFSLSGDCS